MLLAKNTLEEMDPKHLADVHLADVVEFSNTAIIVISRTSAEGTDHTVETLSLSDDEKAMVEKVTSAFENVVVLFNIGNVMEMGWNDEYESIKAAIIRIPGEFGMTAVPRMLDGKVNPSGRLTDIISYKIEDHPSSECFGSYEYEGLVNTFYAMAPSDAPSTAFDENNINKGIWNIMPFYQGDHMSLQGGMFKVNTDVFRLYTEHFDMINRLS